MARRQQLLGQLEEPRGKGKRPPRVLDNPSPRYPVEVKGKAYAAFLDGSSWSDCARAIGHKDPNGTGTQLIRGWAEDDNWQRPAAAGDYKAKVESERAADPERISNEVDDLCVKMQKVSEKYISQYIDDETGEIIINSAFKTRDFADMAAALRMIHETRIKIRKANAPVDKDGGKKNDFLTMIREAGLSRIRDNRRRKVEEVPEEESEEDENRPVQSETEESSRETAQIPSIANIRARVESESAGSTGADGESYAETESLETDSGSDRE